MDLHSFIFPIADLQKRVEKDTTYIGKMRSTDEQPGNYDRMSLTAGEDFMFNDFLEQAASNTYDWIKAFGRNVKKAYRIIPDGELHTVKENLGLHVKLGSEDKGTHFNMTLANTSSEPSVPYVTFDEDEETDTGITYEVQVFSHLNITKGDAASYGFTVRLYYTERVEDSPFTSQRVMTLNYTKTSDVSLDSLMTSASALSLTLLKDDMGTHELVSVNSIEVEVTAITPAEPISIPKGDFVKYIMANGAELYGRLMYDYTGGEPIVDVWTEQDMRNSLTFTIDVPEWTDKNMLPVVETHLTKAIVFYIIYLWFEMTNEKEAERYYNKWEDAAHDAQLGLNTENKILQRHGHWV